MSQTVNATLNEITDCKIATMIELLYKLEAADEISGQLYFNCRLLEVKSDSKYPETKILKSQTNGFRWKVLGYNFLPAKAWKDGLRMMAVESLQPDGHAAAGEILVGEF